MLVSSRTEDGRGPANDILDSSRTDESRDPASDRLECSRADGGRGAASDSLESSRIQQWCLAGPWCRLAFSRLVPCHGLEDKADVHRKELYETMTRALQVKTRRDIAVPFFRLRLQVQLSRKVKCGSFNNLWFRGQTHTEDSRRDGESPYLWFRERTHTRDSRGEYTYI